ncbi:hypothetical protein Lalb_Chr03g0028401 [Lupinus albus]|uniref:Uncharacterized protein n=1 Tax=Lupinus albus TaxID=3870 RepID=A0A6A4QR23_LUPAL|nr:hypothetical protein Lalb_Chr03g0028401 [Lupinus albus]
MKTQNGAFGKIDSFACLAFTHSRDSHAYFLSPFSHHFHKKSIGGKYHNKRHHPLYPHFPHPSSLGGHNNNPCKILLQLRYFSLLLSFFLFIFPSLFNMHIE